jgi:hypothetical protein
MAEDYFSWVAQQPGDKLTRKINQEIREAEEDNYTLKDKQILKHPEDGDQGEAIILLHFTSSKYEEAKHSGFVQPIDVNVEDFNGQATVSKGEVIREKIAEEYPHIEDDYNYEIVDMELDEEEKILYLRFEPF